jgi:hypothetical protein
MVNPNRFYTYAYLREDRTPYYIGKGQGNRAYKKGSRVFLPPPKNRIILLKQNLTEQEAFRHEIYMIAVFGRKDLGTGILRNRTNGGDGVSGAKLFKSREHRKKIAAAHKGKKRVLTEEWKSKLIKLLQDNRYTGGTKVIGKDNGMSKTWEITFADDRKIIRTGLALWAKENGYTKAAIYRVANKKANKHKDIVAVEELAHPPTQEAHNNL